MKKTWKVKDKGYCSDEDLIAFIKKGTVSCDDFVSSDLIKEEVKIKDSVYSFYLGGNTDETI